MSALAIIAAVARNGAIGAGNRLLWHIPGDLKRFKALTTGHAVIMGRKTWESLPEKFRPLPQRRNLVITRDPAYAAPGALVVPSLDAALAACAPNETAFVIGGAEIYALALPRADRLELTEVDRDYVGDVYFPALDRAAWTETAREPGPQDADPPHAFVTLTRRR